MKVTMAREYRYNPSCVTVFYYSRDGGMRSSFFPFLSFSWWRRQTEIAAKTLWILDLLQVVRFSLCADGVVLIERLEKVI